MAAATPKPKHVKMRDDAGKLYDIHPDEVANSGHLTRVEPPKAPEPAKADESDDDDAGETTNA